MPLVRASSKVVGTSAGNLRALDQDYRKPSYVLLER